MRTLAEIQAEIEQLTAGDKQRLLIFIAAKLRSEGGPLPEPRKFTREQMDAWIADDVADMKALGDQAA